MKDSSSLLANSNCLVPCKQVIVQSYCFLLARLRSVFGLQCHIPLYKFGCLLCDPHCEFISGLTHPLMFSVATANPEVRSFTIPSSALCSGPLPVCDE